MHRAAPRAALVALCTALVITLGTAVQQTSAAPTGADRELPDPLVLGPGEWSDGDDAVPSQRHLLGVLEVEKGTDRLTLDLAGARVTGVPRTCRTSSIVRTRSWVSDDGTQLVCRPKEKVTRVQVPVLALGETGEQVLAHVRSTRDGRVQQYDLPSRPILGGTPRLEPRTRLVSSPDFLNADVADLSRGPSSWSKQRSQNGTNAAYDAGLDRVLDTWAALDPAGVMVAGDLVDGRWGVDAQDTGNFGPVDTVEQRREALIAAAGTYYPQWVERFTSHGLTTFPAMGDHEYGDDPWPESKRELAVDFRKQFGKHVLRTPEGERRFSDHPTGQAAKTAYAVRPSPDVQIVSLDVFDITSEQDRIGLDDEQLAWLEDVLTRAREDDVRWIVVQGHVPVVYPVPTRGSSDLHYPGGTDSDLWQLLERFDVDLYLSGEVHDVSAVTRGGVTQVSHGGLFQFGLTNYLLLDFYDDGIYLTLRDFTMRTGEADNGSRLWETDREGMPKKLSVERSPRTIGTASVTEDGLVSGSGVLLPPR